MTLTLFDSENNAILPETPKDFGIRIANEKQERMVNGWNEKALQLLKVYAVTVPDFLTEDFRIYAEANGLEKPKEPRAYGALIVMAKKSGIIKATGIYRTMKSTQSHSCPKRVWQSNL